MQPPEVDEWIWVLRRAKGIEQKTALESLTHHEKNAVILRLLEKQEALSKVIPDLVSQVDAAVATVEQLTEKV